MKKAILFLFLAAPSFAYAQTPVLTGDLNTGGDSDPRWLTAYNSKLFFRASDGTHGNELCSLTAAGTPVMAYDMKTGSAGSGTIGFNVHMAVYNGKMYFGAMTTTNQLMVYDGTNAPAVAPGMSGAGSPTGISELMPFSGKLYFRGGAALYSYDGTNPPTIVRGTATLGPSEPTPYNGRLYFTGFSNSTTPVVYAYDPAADSLYSMFSPGSSGSSSSVYVPGAYCVAGGKLFFGARTAAYGWELYSCDGTTVTRITDLTPGPGNGARGGMAAINNTLIFGGATDSTNYQLYKYDIATSSVSLAQTINPSGNARVNNIVNCNGKVYFSASTAATGNEPWVWNGTSASMVADLNPGAANSYPSEFYSFGNSVYFNATNGASGNELFRIGTPTDVQQVSFSENVRLYPNPAGSTATIELSLKSPQAFSIWLSDLTGKAVWVKETCSYDAGRSGVTIPLAGLAAGTYFYYLADADGKISATGRVVKE